MAVKLHVAKRFHYSSAYSYFVNNQFIMYSAFESLYMQSVND